MAHVQLRLTTRVGLTNVPRVDAAGLPALVEAIRHLHGLEATWLESAPVHEQHEGATVWQGEVQVFAVEHPKATRVYAWSHETEGWKRRFGGLDFKSGHYPSSNFRLEKWALTRSLRPRIGEQTITRRQRALLMRQPCRASSSAVPFADRMHPVGKTNFVGRRRFRSQEKPF
jgi:hypothetical protein